LSFECVLGYGSVRINVLWQTDKLRREKRGQQVDLQTEN
jgi:hypothetical protein